MRLLVVLAIATLAPGSAAACVFADEADQLLGWSEDGRYALYARTGDYSHAGAEIHPTRLRSDPIYWISWEAEHRSAALPLESQVGKERWLVVRARRQDKCMPYSGVPFGGEIVERKEIRRQPALSCETLSQLETFQKLKLRCRAPAQSQTSARQASFTPRRRYTDPKHYCCDDHQVVLKDGAREVVLDLPLTCVGSCLRDEAWDRWTVKVVAVHEVAGLVLYELGIEGMCNGARGRNLWMPRLVAASSADDERAPRSCDENYKRRLKPGPPVPDSYGGYGL